MKRIQAVEYMDKIQLALDLFKKYDIPFEYVNIQQEDGVVQGAGIIFKGLRWKDGKLVEGDSSSQVINGA